MGASLRPAWLLPWQRVTLCAMDSFPNCLRTTMGQLEHVLPYDCEASRGCEEKRPPAACTPIHLSVHRPVTDRFTVQTGLGMCRMGSQPFITGVRSLSRCGFIMREARPFRSLWALPPAWCVCSLHVLPVSLYIPSWFPSFLLQSRWIHVTENKPHMSKCKD